MISELKERIRLRARDVRFVPESIQIGGQIT